MPLLPKMSQPKELQPREPKQVREPSPLAQQARRFHPELLSAARNLVKQAPGNARFFNNLKRQGQHPLSDPNNLQNYKRGLQQAKQGYLNSGEEGAYQAILQHLQSLQPEQPAQSPPSTDD